MHLQYSQEQKVQLELVAEICYGAYTNLIALHSQLHATHLSLNKASSSIPGYVVCRLACQGCTADESAAAYTAPVAGWQSAFDAWLAVHPVAAEVVPPAWHHKQCIVRTSEDKQVQCISIHNRGLRGKHNRDKLLTEVHRPNCVHKVWPGGPGLLQQADTQPAVHTSEIAA